VTVADLIGRFQEQSWLNPGPDRRPPDPRRAVLLRAARTPRGLAVTVEERGNESTAVIEVPEPDRERLMEVLAGSEGRTLREIEEQEVD